MGHDVATVHDEGLGGRPDSDVAGTVKAERRCIVTFDLGFADKRRHPPAQYAGIVVLRLRAPTSSTQVRRLRSFFAAEPTVEGHLWVVEEPPEPSRQRPTAGPPPDTMNLGDRFGGGGA